MFASIQKATRIFVVSIVVLTFASSCSVFSQISDSISTSVSQIVASISHVVGSISTSFESSSDSSKKKSPQAKAFGNEVRIYTAMHIKNGRTSDAALLKDIDRAATKYGFIRFESQPITYIAIGCGMKDAGISPDIFKGFLDDLKLGKNRNEITALLQEGYTQGL